MKAAAIGDLDHRCVRIGVRIRRAGVGRIDADIVSGEALDQLALCCDRPFFNLPGEPVSIRQNEIREFCLIAFFAALRGADEAGDHRGERRG